MSGGECGGGIDYRKISFRSERKGKKRKKHTSRSGLTGKIEGPCHQSPGERTQGVVSMSGGWWKEKEHL